MNVGGRVFHLEQIFRSQTIFRKNGKKGFALLNFIIDGCYAFSVLQVFCFFRYDDIFSGEIMNQRLMQREEPDQNE